MILGWAKVLSVDESNEMANASRMRNKRVPLTLTLSPEEREPSHPVVEAIEASRLVETLGAFLPLLRGEGRGEGNRRTKCSVSAKTTRLFLAKEKLIARIS